MLPESPEPPPPQLPFPAFPRERPTGAARATALLEVLVCSDYPTQLATQLALRAFGLGVGPHDSLTIGFVVALSLVDTALLVGLIVLFLYAHGDQLRDVFLGARPIASEPSSSASPCSDPFSISRRGCTRSSTTRCRS
jgi:hypothetical protein